MDLRFSENELAFRDEVRAWVAKNLPADIRDKVERGIEPARDDLVRWMRILSDKGWLATNWDAKDGGPGFTPAQKFLFEDELFLGGAPRTIHFGTRMVGPVLLAFGTEEQKRRYLPSILTSEEIWCQGYSEPGAGSDLASLRTRAVRDGDRYIVNGTKIWTSYAHCADRMFTLVRTGEGGKPIRPRMTSMRPGWRPCPARRAHTAPRPRASLIRACFRPKIRWCSNGARG